MSETSAQGIYYIITAADSLGDAPGPLLVVPYTKNLPFFLHYSRPQILLYRHDAYV